MPVRFSDKSSWNAQSTFLNGTNVATLGEVNALLSGINYGSQGDIGKRFFFAESEAIASTFTATANLASGTLLYGGGYQLVQVSASATAANVAQGLACFLLDGTSNAGASGYVVTDEAHAVALTHLIGVFLNSITPGNYGFIQVFGKATVKYRATVTATTAGSTVIVTGAGDGTFDAPTQSGSPTFIQMGQIIGTAIQAPASGAYKTVQMKNQFFGRF